MTAPVPLPEHEEAHDTVTRVRLALVQAQLALDELWKGGTAEEPVPAGMRLPAPAAAALLHEITSSVAVLARVVLQIRDLIHIGPHPDLTAHHDGAGDALMERRLAHHCISAAATDLRLAGEALETGYEHTARVTFR